MIVLDTNDTNVILELMRPEPAAQPRTVLYTTSVTQTEIRYGVVTLPSGWQRDALAAAAIVGKR